jgi:hypothetical protein
MRTPRLNIFLITLCVACLPALARASDLAITSSTQYQWYSDPLSTNTRQSEAIEYLRLNSSLDTDGNIRFIGYGRVMRQFETSPESSGANWFGRLYYLALDFHDLLKGHIDLRLGRTYVNEAAIPGVVDGLYVNFKNLGGSGLGITAFGGHRATFDNKGEVSATADTLFGGSVYLATVLQTHAELSFAAKYNAPPSGSSASENLSQEFVALDFATTPIQQVNFTGRANYDLTESRYSELLAQLNLTPVTPLIVRGEFYASMPTFDQYSFYRYFGVTQYQQYKVAAEYQFNANYHVRVNYANEHFDSSTTANVFDAGVYLRPVEALILDVSYQYRSGYAGNLNGVRFHGSYRFGSAAILAGGDYADFKLDTFQAQMDTNAKKYWGGVSYDFTKNVGVSVRGEEDFNFYFVRSFQGLAALNVNI